MRAGLPMGLPDELSSKKDCNVQCFRAWTGPRVRMQAHQGILCDSLELHSFDTTGHMQHVTQSPPTSWKSMPEIHFVLLSKSIACRSQDKDKKIFKSMLVVHDPKVMCKCHMLVRQIDVSVLFWAADYFKVQICDSNKVWLLHTPFKITSTHLQLSCV